MNLKEQLNEYQPFLDAIKRGEIVECNFRSRWSEVTNLHALMYYSVNELRIVDPYKIFRDAEKAGKSIQFKKSDGSWLGDFHGERQWNYNSAVENYRIKPEPQKVKVAIKFRENEEPLIYRVDDLAKSVLHHFQIEEITQKI